MKSTVALSTFLAIATAISIPAQAQPAATRARLSGTLTSVNADAKQLSVRSDQGEDVSVTTTDRTVFLRIPPGETDPKQGAKVALSALSAGDRAVIIGPPPADSKNWSATSVLVMSKRDVAGLQQKDQDDWKKRGTTGTVTAVDPAAKTITIRSGSHLFTVEPSGKTAYYRYSADSARFSDSKPSNFEEIHNGDQLRVLGNASGDKSGDSAVIQAEKIVSGSFRQLAATISAINPQTGELTVKDLATKKNITIRTDSNSEMRKLPEMAARMLARRYAPGAQQAESTGVPPGGAGRSGRSGDIGQMLDSLPAMPLSELKPGDAIMVSTTQGSDPGRVTAITLLAGVEPLLTASSTATRDIMGGWNLGGGGGETGQ